MRNKGLEPEAVKHGLCLSVKFFHEMSHILNYNKRVVICLHEPVRIKAVSNA